MDIDKYGRISLTENDIFEGLYSGKITDLSNIEINDQIVCQQFNNSKIQNGDQISELKLFKDLQITKELFDDTNQQQWFMPDNYCPDLIQEIYRMCKTDEQKDRVSLELELFIQHGMMDLLFYLKYLVDTMRENNIVWGVGRGSSVASYVLYLLGIHKIDSIKYQLDIKEFLK